MVPSSPQVQKIRRRWLFRLGAIAIGMTPFLLLEGALRLWGPEYSTVTDDPFVGFASIQPLFEIDSSGGNRVIAESRRIYFAHDQFRAKKAEKSYRIFCLGGSTVQGRPYSIETSFTTWLELALKTIAPDTNWEVVNCGGVSYASYRLVPILAECLGYEPDLIIVCTGHNEFLEDRTYQTLKQRPRWLNATASLGRHLRTVNLAAELLNCSEEQKSTLASDADAILNYKGGLAAYHRDDDWHQSIAEHFELNLIKMRQMAQSRGVPILLLKPPSNLSGVAPFKSETGEVTAEQLDQIELLKSKTLSLYQTDLEQAANLWNQICKIDPRCATYFYERGRCLETLQRFDEARKCYVAARDQDLCPLRMTSLLEQKFENAVRLTNVSTIDLHEYLEEQTANGILGSRWLVDHVHPNFEGHQKIAFRLIKWLAEQGTLALPGGWKEKTQAVFQDHFDSLNRTYFHRGQRALKALQQWTQGNADGPAAQSRFPHRMNSAD